MKRYCRTKEPELGELLSLEISGVPGIARRGRGFQSAKPRVLRSIRGWHARLQ